MMTYSILKKTTMKILIWTHSSGERSSKITNLTLF